MSGLVWLQNASSIDVLAAIAVVAIAVYLAVRSFE